MNMKTFAHLAHVATYLVALAVILGALLLPSGLALASNDYQDMTGHFKIDIGGDGQASAADVLNWATGTAAPSAGLTAPRCATKVKGDLNCDGVVNSLDAALQEKAPEGALLYGTIPNSGSGGVMPMETIPNSGSGGVMPMETIPNKGSGGVMPMETIPDRGSGGVMPFYEFKFKVDRKPKGESAPGPQTDPGSMLLPQVEPLVKSSPPSPITSSIAYWADRYVLNHGECTYLRWDVENVQEVYLEGHGVAGHASQLICPAIPYRYRLSVLHRNGTWEQRYVDIKLVGSGSGGNSSPGGPSAPNVQSK